MNSHAQPQQIAAPANPFSTADVEAILRERGWLNGIATPEMELWLDEAAALLGPQAASGSPSPAEGQAALVQLLNLIFSYDARSLLENSENQAVLAREGPCDVIRELANRVLDAGEIDSDRFRQIIENLKLVLGFHGRKLFRPIRLALAGRSGEGDLDRVILLLDCAAKLEFQTPVKGARQRIIEFCAALE